MATSVRGFKVRALGVFKVVGSQSSAALGHEALGRVS